MTPRRWMAVALVAALAVTVAGCGGDDAPDASQIPSTIDPADVTTTTTTAPTSTGPTTTVAEDLLPPAGALELEPRYGAQLAALGLRLTDRGGLIDRTGGGYQPSAQGTHLALYVEPIGEYTMPQYLEGIRTVTAIFAGDVFTRWPGLVSFDVCQEPSQEDDPRAEPLPVTQIEMTSDEAAAIDFATVSVVELVRASLADPPGLALRVSSRVAGDPAYQAIVAEATP